MTLKLEYTCTAADLKEAQKIHLQQQCGGGPKWRSRLLYWLFIAVIAVLLWFRFKMEIAPKDRWWFIALVVVAFIGLQFFKRLTRRNPEKPVHLEVSERELAFNTHNGRSALPWSAFCPCMESPTLFVLLNTAKTTLWTIPKRAFPDEKSMEWFRALSHQPRTAAAAPAVEEFAPGRFVAKGIAVTIQLKYRDYITRMYTSWRTRGMLILVMAVFGVATAASCLNPPPHAVVPPGEVFLIGIGMMIPIFTVVFLVVTYVSWRSEKKYLRPQNVACTAEGLQFASHDGSGLLAWSAYTYYLENRWAFFVWNPRGSLWMMFPKRVFSSPMEIEQFRDLLRMNLKPSRWFFF